MGYIYPDNPREFDFWYMVVKTGMDNYSFKKKIKCYLCKTKTLLCAGKVVFTSSLLEDFFRDIFLAFLQMVKDDVSW